MSLDRSQLGKRLAHIERELAEIKQWLTPKRMLSLSEAIPPESVCRDLLSKTRGVNDYIGFLAILSDYYHIPPMRLLWDQYNVWMPQAKAKSVAAYFAEQNAAYTKKKAVEKDTVLHEFFHHLVAHNVVAVGKGKDEEKAAVKFAVLVLERGGEQ